MRSTSARTAPAPAWSCSCLRGTLRERALEDGLGDAVLEDLDRAAGDHPAAALAPAPLDQRVLGVAHAAHDLHRLVAALEARLVAVGLGDRRLLRGGQPAVGVDGGAVEQELPGVEFHLHVRELPLDALEFREQAPELLALRGPLARLLVAVAPERERARRVADALDVEAGDLFFETAFLEQHVLGP